jgi:hypothetical protein
LNGDDCVAAAARPSGVVSNAFAAWKRSEASNTTTSEFSWISTIINKKKNQKQKPTMRKHNRRNQITPQVFNPA